MKLTITKAHLSKALRARTKEGYMSGEHCIIAQAAREHFQVNEVGVGHGALYVGTFGNIKEYRHDGSFVISQFDGMTNMKYFKQNLPMDITLTEVTRNG